MRLIDADALMQSLKILNTDCGGCESADPNYGNCMRDFAEACTAIKDAPTIEERKKGEWNHGLCSVCGYDWGKDAPIANVPPFCPNCGTDMRESNKLLNNCSKCKHGKNYLNNMWWCEKHDMMKNREGESCSDFKNKY